MEPLLAFDLSPASCRQKDADGHLHVAANTITEAGISPYLGREIPGWRELGLDADRVYKLLRDPQELQRGAATANGKPLLSTHRPLHAEDHAHALTVGAVANARLVDDRLIAELSIWDGDAIRSIEDGSQRSLSCGYRYVPVMRPGTYRGQAYDGVMTSIAFNHVALVDRPRVKSAFVGDSLPAFLRKPLLRARELLVMDSDTTENDNSLDPIERVCSMLRSARVSDTNIGALREHIARLIKSAAEEAERGNVEPPPQQAMDSFSQRFPDARRVTSRPAPAADARSPSPLERERGASHRFPDAGRLVR